MKFAVFAIACAAVSVQGVALQKLTRSRTPDSSIGTTQFDNTVPDEAISKGTVTGFGQARTTSVAEKKQIGNMLATQAERLALNNAALDQQPPPDNVHWAKNHDTGIARTGFNDYYGDGFVNVAHPHPSVAPKSAQGAMQAHWEQMQPPSDNIHWARNKNTGLARTGFNDYYGPNHASFSDHVGDDDVNWISHLDKTCSYLEHHQAECDLHKARGHCNKSCPPVVTGVTSTLTGPSVSPQVSGPSGAPPSTPGPSVSPQLTGTIETGE